MNFTPTLRGDRAPDISTGKIISGNLWKLRAGKDPRLPKVWMQRDMWISENRSLCYYSQLEKKRLVLIDLERLKVAEIEPLEGAAYEHCMVITCNPDEGEEDGGKVFVFATETAAELDQWVTLLRCATVDAMPTMRLGEAFAQEMGQMKVKNRRRRIEAEYRQEYEPIWKTKLWKVKAAGDRMCEAHWLERDVWLSCNGSLVYWSHKEHRELVYYTQDDIRSAQIKVMPKEGSLYPWSFQISLLAKDGVEFMPGEFAAESEEMLDRWVGELSKFCGM